MRKINFLVAFFSSRKLYTDMSSVSPLTRERLEASSWFGEHWSLLWTEVPFSQWFTLSPVVHGILCLQMWVWRRHWLCPDREWERQRKHPWLGVFCYPHRICTYLIQFLHYLSVWKSFLLSLVTTGFSDEFSLQWTTYFSYFSLCLVKDEQDQRCLKSYLMA